MLNIDVVESMHLDFFDEKIIENPAEETAEENLKNYIDKLTKISPDPGYFYLRADKKHSKKDKFAVWHDPTKVPTHFDSDEFYESLVKHTGMPKQKLRPLEPNGTVYSPGGHPIAGYSPNGSKYLPEQDLKVCVILSARGAEGKYKEPLSKIPLPTKEGPAWKAIKQPEGNQKSNSIEFTSEHLQKMENFEKPKSRNQQKVVCETDENQKNASATKYANELKIAKGLKFEWLHLIAFNMLHLISQAEGNLVVGTAHANTLMIPPERMIPNLAKYFEDIGLATLTLEAKADLVKGTQVATYIDYDIIITTKTGESFIIPFQFNAQNRVKPHKDMKIIMDGIFKVMVEGIVTKIVTPIPKPKKESPVRKKLDFDNIESDNISGKENEISTKAEDYAKKCVMPKTFLDAKRPGASVSPIIQPPLKKVKK